MHRPRPAGPPARPSSPHAGPIWAIVPAAVACLVAAASPALAKPARCFTTDDGHFDCEFRATDRRGSFEIGAPGLPLYGIEVERPGSAFGFVTIDGRTIPLPGRYLRESGDGACWSNSETGARICAW